MKKTIVFLILFSAAAQAQHKTNIGFNLPLFVDNQIEISSQHKFQKRLMFVGIIGGSTKTRGFFKNTGINRNDFYDQTASATTKFSDRSAGFYGKIGLNFLFALPEFFEDKPLEEATLRFYVGPIVGVSQFRQSGRLTGYTYNQMGLPEQLQTKNITEKGVVSGTGFNIGLTAAANKDYSVDFGVEYLGFERKSELKEKANTLGLGINPVIRVNYNF